MGRVKTKEGVARSPQAQDKDQRMPWHLAPGNPGVLSGSWQWDGVHRGSG